jgi:diacylglycerol kinase family enzyme
MHGGRTGSLGLAGSPRLAVVVNRAAKRHRTGSDPLAPFRQAAGPGVLLRATSSVDELPAIAKEVAAAEVDVVAISGGDGTVGTTLTALRDVYGDRLPRVALLRGGTNNTVARSLGAPRKEPASALADLAHALRRGDALAYRRVRTIAANGRLSFLFGTGFGRRFLDDYYARGRPHPTPWTAARTLARFCGSTLVGGPTARRAVALERLRIHVDGQPWQQGAYRAVMGGSVAQVGLGFRPFAAIGERTDVFALVALFGPAHKLVTRMPRAFRGEHMGDDVGTMALCRSASLEAEEGTLHYFTDGELLAAEGSLELQLGPTIRVEWA